MVMQKALFTLALLSFSAAGALDHEWLGTTSNDWNTASNWTNGVPTMTGDNAIFDQNTPFTTVNISSTVSPTNIDFNTLTSYTLTGAGITGTPTLNVSLGSHQIDTFVGAFITTTINVNPGASLTFGSGGSISCLAVVISGGGNLTFQPSAVLSVNDVTINGTDVTFIAQSNVATTFLTVNGGTVNNLQGGQISGPGGVVTFNGGTFNNQGGSTLAGTFLEFNGATVINEGASSIKSIGGGGTIIFNGGTITNGVGSSILEATAFNLNDNGVLINAGTIASSNVYSQGPNTTLIEQVLSPTSLGTISATHTLIGGSLGVSILPGYSIEPGQQLPIVTGISTFQGTFSDVYGIDLPDLFPVITYQGNTVFLSFTPTLFSYPNTGEAVFASINHTNLGLSRRMDTLRDHMGEVATHETSRLSAQLMLADATSSPNPEIQQKHEELKQTVTSDTQRRLNIYAGPLGSVGTVSSKGAQVGYSYTSVGGLAGIDYAFKKVGLGFLVDYERINADMRKHWGEFDVNQLHGSLYATYAPIVEFAVNTIVGGSFDWYKIERKTGTDARHVKAKGTPSGSEFDALLGVEYTWNKNNTEVMPYLSAQYIHLNVPGYREKDGGTFNLNVSSQNAKSLRGMLGMRVNHVWTWTDFKFQPEINAAWQREFLDKGKTIGVSPAELIGASNTVALARSGRNTALVGLNLLFTLYDRYGIEANYDYEWNESFQDNFFFVGFNARF
jgi:hypothetical protein